MSTKNNKDEPLLMVNDIDLSILLFLFITDLRSLSKLDVIYVDGTIGTFQCGPKQFYQCFTICGIQNTNNYVQLAFFLLHYKSKNSYKNTFDFLIKECYLYYIPIIVY